ncbi:GAF domain-containing SpoIIE family protein phosphatase [Nocardioides sp. HM23]|uniref:PP2C family protein-serine/threonine phosphatase n=1 Tax=Nocardioides bizhenqiangii TaxID=3095076 RepID=UPI002ACAA6C6|nr:GAF domain-containing SpoIIE family protein phosphatase [Nocardioides sp. HM23]MDZ5620434.1 GAF domain-containing SpoIIE family protein phosphatase [Nocardioides sp. HM23]
MDLVSVQGLIDNVRAMMSSDTATLLLLDETGRVLEPAASAGLGRRWRGAPHVRVGSGFAGKVAEDRRPTFVNEVNEGSVLNPILREAGVQRLLGVPVFGRNGLLGVLHVGSLGAREFTLDDAERLEGAAAEIGARLSDRTEDDAHLAALVLQRSLLPAAPPTIDGLDVAVRYLPAEGDLGGDWYDVFTLPNGKTGFVMGDVEGHGLRAAIVMGRLRSALRAYALDHDDPAEVVQRLDRKLCYFESEISATVVYAVTEPPFDQVVICSAGHPAPLIARAGRTAADPADIQTGLLLGLEPEGQRQSEKIVLEPGTALAFFTDGLVERRGGPDRHPDQYGERLELVRQAFSAGHNAETICSRIIAVGLGDESVEDDVALVVVRRPL